jgi:hypothetical protein
MIGSHLVISAVVTAAALAGCFTYLLRPPVTSVKIDRQPHLGKLTFSGPDTTASKGADRHRLRKSSDRLLGSRPGHPEASTTGAGVRECR